MKYLKLFEDMNQDGYEEVTYFEWQAMPCEETFNDKELKELRRLGFKFPKECGLENTLVERVLVNEVKKRPIDGSTFLVCLMKDEDEWYTVDTTGPGTGGRSRYYTCEKNLRVPILVFFTLLINW